MIKTMIVLHKRLIYGTSLCHLTDARVPRATFSATLFPSLGCTSSVTPRIFAGAPPVHFDSLGPLPVLSNTPDSYRPFMRKKSFEAELSICTTALYLVFGSYEI